MKPTLKRDWIGLLVKSTRPIQTKGGSVFPERTVFRVKRNRGGLWLEAVEACDRCRLKHIHTVKGVSERDVVIIDKEIAGRIRNETANAEAVLRAARNMRFAGETKDKVDLERELIDAANRYAEGFRQ